MARGRRETEDLVEWVQARGADGGHADGVLAEEVGVCGAVGEGGEEAEGEEGEEGGEDGGAAGGVGVDCICARIDSSSG